MVKIHLPPGRRSCVFVVVVNPLGPHQLETCLASIQASGSVDRSERRLARRTNFPMKRVNHSVEYKSDDGACTNQAESYFSRLRKMISGQHHHVSARHLHAYAAHAAWMEDHRKLDNGALAKRAVSLCLEAPVSRNWKGRWQRSLP